MFRNWNLLGTLVVLSLSSEIFSSLKPQPRGRFPTSDELDSSGNDSTDGRRGAKSYEMDDANENVCSTGESYMMIDSATSCCNHTIILNHGLDLGKFWKECAVGLRSPKSKTEIANENYINASRRIYACVLSKHLRKQTTNLLGFATVMTAKYPTNIKNAILKLAKAQSNNEKPLADYNELRSIRNSYMDIQRLVCARMDQFSDGSRSAHLNKSAKTSSRCDQSEEVELNGGSCCQGQSVPLDLDFWHPPPTNATACNESLAGVFKKWSIPKSDMESAMEICAQACTWKQNGVISSRILETARMSNEKDVIAHMRKVAPAYLSPYMMNMVLNYTRVHSQTAGFEKEISKRFQLSDSTIIALRPCIGYWRISIVLYDALYEFCNPPTSEDNRRIQTKSFYSDRQGYDNYYAS